MLVVHYAGKYFNTACLITLILQYRQSVKHVFDVSVFLIDNTLQTASPFINAAVNQSAVAVRATPARSPAPADQQSRTSCCGRLAPAMPHK